MNNREKIDREKKMIGFWDELKRHKQSLMDLVFNKRDFTPLDYILLFQCVCIVAENLAINEQEIKDAPDVIPTVDGDKKIDTIFGRKLNEFERVIGKELLGDIECLCIISDEKYSVGERFEAIERLKMIGWKTLYSKKNEITHLLIENYFGKLQDPEIALIFRCVFLVLMELDIKEQEIKILEQLYNTE